MTEPAGRGRQAVFTGDSDGAPQVKVIAAANTVWLPSSRKVRQNRIVWQFTGYPVLDTDEAHLAAYLRGQVNVHGHYSFVHRPARGCTCSATPPGSRNSPDDTHTDHRHLAHDVTFRSAVPRRPTRSGGVRGSCCWACAILATNGWSRQSASHGLFRSPHARTPLGLAQPTPGWMNRSKPAPQPGRVLGARSISQLCLSMLNTCGGRNGVDGFGGPG